MRNRDSKPCSQNLQLSPLLGLVVTYNGVKVTGENAVMGIFDNEPVSPINWPLQPADWTLCPAEDDVAVDVTSVDWPLSGQI